MCSYCKWVVRLAVTRASGHKILQQPTRLKPAWKTGRQWWWWSWWPHKCTYVCVLISHCRVWTVREPNTTSAEYIAVKYHTISRRCYKSISEIPSLLWKSLSEMQTIYHLPSRERKTMSSKLLQPFWVKIFLLKMVADCLPLESNWHNFNKISGDNSQCALVNVHRCECVCMSV